MQTAAKYIIHADIRTSGVVERSDVVGAIFGQTEGLLGENMDLRDLQDASKVGRIDVDVDSEGGRSFGTVRIASALDRAETAVLAASLETIERVGPCRANCEVVKIEDARAAKRRQVVDRATELLAEFESQTLTSDRLVDEVRERLRESELTEYHGFPAGPRVADSDAIIVVEGRADVRKLLSVGIKNAVAVEGTDIPEPIARLTTERTTTAFLDGDRGGDLVLRELAQVGDVDYVAFAPSGKSVEDLDRAAIMGALRKKLPSEQVEEGTTPRETFSPTDGGQSPVAEPAETDGETELQSERSEPAPSQTISGPEERSEEPTEQLSEPGPADRPTAPSETIDTAETAQSDESERRGAATLGEHVRAVIEAETETARLLDEQFDVLVEGDADSAFELLEAAETVPHTVVIDGVATQRILDVAAQRGVGQIIATETDEYVKQPVSVRVHEASEIEVE